MDCHKISVECHFHDEYPEREKEEKEEEEEEYIIHVYMHYEYCILKDVCLLLIL